ncbi:MAG: hypothetical protein LN563_00505, partial [Rickettsia endosymbiont of Platyusa sonomae]|nr:hypothetical protein [Rickettsia endosymbiont of Platyusa sonomae]
MPELYDNSATEIIGSGVLALDVVKQPYFKEIVEFAHSSGIVLPITPDATNEEIRTQGYILVSSLLDNIIATPQKESNSNILGKCLDILKAAGEHGNVVLSSHVNDQLITLLLNDNYSEHRTTICHVLINGEYVVSDEQSIKLNKLVISLDPNSSSLILELLLAKGKVGSEILGNILKYIEVSKASDIDDLVYKQQLLLIVQSFNNNSSLKEKLAPQILDFFKSYQDISFLSEMAKIIGNADFFEPVITELKNNFQCLEKLLEIESKVCQTKQKIISQGSVPNQFGYLLDSPDVILTENSSKFILDLYNINLPNKTWSLNDYYQTLKYTQVLLNKILRCKIPVNTEFICCYEKYVTELLLSSYFRAGYPSILTFSTNICAMLLTQDRNISGECLEVLISSLNNNPINNANLANISEILAILASHNKIPILSINTSIALLKSCTNSSNQNNINNIVGAFENFARFKIQDDNLTDIICEKYLGQSLVLDRILGTLEIIASNSGKLPEQSISSLTEFILDLDNGITLRIRAIELLQRVAGGIREEDVSNLSKLLKGEKQNIYMEVDYNNSQLPLANNIDWKQFDLEYLQSIKDTGATGDILDDIGDNNLIAKKSSTEVIDYKTALAVTKLLAKYAAAKHGRLTEVSINSLEQALNNDVLAAEALAALAIVAEKHPALLKQELFDYIKEHHSQIHYQILFNTSLDSLDKLLNDELADHSIAKVHDKSKLIGEELNKLIDLLKGDGVQNIGRLYQIISKTLIVNPDLFSECLLLVQRIILLYSNDLKESTNEDIKVINQLIDFKQISYRDLCWFLSKGCYSKLLHKAIEEYFNSNIDKLLEDSHTLREMLGGLSSLVVISGDLALDTINNLISLAKDLPAQAVNIIRIIQLNKANLADYQFSLLEELFNNSNKQLTLVLSNLWAKAGKQLLLPKSIAVLFKFLESKTPLGILPTSQLREEAKILLQLRSADASIDKISLITSLEGRELQIESINTILHLIKSKNLTKACIKVLANLFPPPYLDEEISEIICKSREGLEDEYLKLKAFLTGDVEVFLLSEQQRRIKNIIEIKFPDWHLTHFYLEQLEKSLNYHSDSPEFMEEILLGIILEKASSIEEYSNFLKLINKHNISQQEIISNLGYASLANIIDVIETKILSESLENLEGLGADDILARIRQFCYQLKSKGWSVSNLVEILQYINANNILFFVSGFTTIYEYQITDEQRNKEGDTVVDIVSKEPGKKLEPAIYTIASNQFEHKLENKGAELLKKFVELNPDLAGKAEEYVATLQRIQSLYSASDNGLAIKDWNAEQVKEWAIKFKASCSPGSIISKDDLVKLIAVLQRANNLHTVQNGKEGHLLRDTQIASLLLLLDYAPINKGKLLQIATGEGKSTISAMLAAILALNGEKVDLITSSPVLSSIGYEGARGFFELLGLSVDINIGKANTSGEKACYSCDIVYGDALSFQTDFLSNTSGQGASRGDRDFAVTIVDEVDSMLVDSSNHIAKQTAPVPLMEYLLPILTIAWNNFQKVILPMNFEESFAIERTREMIESIIDASPIPKHLVQYAKFQAGNWAASLVGAALKLQLDIDYVININADGKKVINPVDSSTGVTQENMVWQNGLHQFLQIKHNCRISSEGLTTFFISNICYFLKYGKILGMTGTLGSDSSQKFVKTIYGVDITFVPTYKDKQVIELPARLEPTLDDLREAVCESSYQEAILHNRAVLIICKNIKDAAELCTALENKCGNKGKIINYSRSEKTLYNSDIEQLARSNTIIVATNLAGRGTDIKTSSEVEANGGLHVISTFIAKNARDEAQVKGRTARQGNSGSYQIIACVLDYDNYQAFEGVSDEEIINIKKQQRDRQESQKISYNIEQRIPALLADDKLYQKFTASYLELAGVRGERAALDYKIKQFIEEFGLWFKTHKEDGSIESFIASAKSNYQSGTYSNPSYAVLQHFGISNPWTVLVALSKATSIDDIYNFPAYYYAAKCWLDIGPKDEKNYKNKAIESLMDAGNRLSEILSYLTAMSVSVASKTGSDNELLHQITTKIGFFKSFFDHIQSAIKLISESGKDEVRVKGHINKETLAPKLHKSDIVEIDFLGISGVFELETYKPRQNWQDTILVAVCAIAQMAVGVFIAVGTLGGGTPLAVSIFTEGLMDAYKVAMSVHKGESINLESYFLGKAISYAVIGAQVGFSKLAPATTTAGTAGAAGTTKAATAVGTTVGTAGTTEIVKDLSTTQLIAQLAEASAIQFATVMAIEKTVDWVSDGIRENALDGLEERIASNVGNAASQALGNNSILLTANCNIERNQIMNEVQKAIFQATKTNEHAMVINQLASGIAQAAASNFKGSSSSSGIDLTTAVKVTHAAITVVDVMTKIDPIIDNIKDAITTIINQAGTRAKERLGSNASSAATDGNQDSLNKLSKNIGEMAANSMLSLLQRKITPTLNLGVSYVADKMVGNYQKEQMDLLEKHRQQLIVSKKEEALKNPSLQNTPPNTIPLPNTSSLRKQGSNLAPQAEHLPLGHGSGLIKSEHIGFAGLTSSDLALASLLPKPSSGGGSSNSILLLSSAMKQPIYVFENGKLLQSYGKGLGGTPITIGYDSKNQQYFGFTNKGTGNSGSIFEAISGSTQGKYSADILKGIACPIVPKEPLNPPSPSTPQPKPLSPAELSGAKFLLATLTADKQAA